MLIQLIAFVIVAEGNSNSNHHQLTLISNWDISVESSILKCCSLATVHVVYIEICKAVVQVAANISIAVGEAAVEIFATRLQRHFRLSEQRCGRTATSMGDLPGPAGRRAGTAGSWSSPRRRTWKARPRRALRPGWARRRRRRPRRARTSRRPPTAARTSLRTRSGQPRRRATQASLTPTRRHQLSVWATPSTLIMLAIL